MVAILAISAFNLLRYLKVLKTALLSVPPAYLDHPFRS